MSPGIFIFTKHPVLQWIPTILHWFSCPPLREKCDYASGYQAWGCVRITGILCLCPASEFLAAWPRMCISSELRDQTWRAVLLEGWPASLEALQGGKNRSSLLQFLALSARRIIAKLLKSLCSDCIPDCLSHFLITGRKILNTHNAKEKGLMLALSL